MELNTGDIQATRGAAGIPFSISSPETANAWRRRLARRAGGGARRSHAAASARDAFASQASRLFSNAISLVSRSPIFSRARTAVITRMTSVASSSDTLPCAQAARSARAALTKSPAFSISGRSNVTG
jgi:hypothetical protein